MYSSAERNFIGNYDSQIDEALADYGVKNPTNFQRYNSLFYCVGPPGGQIAVLDVCTIACKNAGTGNDDYCLDDSDFPVSNGRNRLKANPPRKDGDRRLVINW